MHYNELRWLTPDARGVLSQFLKRLAAAGLSPKVAETYRPQSVQNVLAAKSSALVASGRAPLTKTAHSWHSVGRAADVNISPATTDNILTFLDLANELGLRTLPDPDKVRQYSAAGDSAALNKELWDWHHVEFRNGRDYAKAKVEYDQLARRGPSTGPEVAELLSGVLTVGALSSALRNQ